jgi:hypothetical protein
MSEQDNPESLEGDGPFHSVMTFTLNFLFEGYFARQITLEKLAEAFGIDAQSKIAKGGSPKIPPGINRYAEGRGGAFCRI